MKVQGDIVLNAEIKENGCVDVRAPITSENLKNAVVALNNDATPKRSTGLHNLLLFLPYPLQYNRSDRSAPTLHNDGRRVTVETTMGRKFT